MDDEGMFFEKNLNALSNRNANLIGKLNEIFSEKVEMNENQVRWGRDLMEKDIPYILGESGNYTSLCSEYSVKNQMDKWFQQFDKLLKKDSLVYLMGLGTGDIVRRIAESLSKDGTLIIYEPSAELFFQLMERWDFSDVFSKKNIYIFLSGINDDNLINFLDGYCEKKWIQPERIVVMHQPNYMRLYPQAAEKFDNYLLEWSYVSQTNNVTAIFWMKDIVASVFEKLHFYKDALLVERMRADWNPDIPVVMVAAGPSLKKNIKLLKQAKGHMLIVAVDHALSVLHEEGIVPDIIACLDAEDAYIKVGEEFRNIPFLCNSNANKESYDWNTGIKLLAGDKPVFQRLKPKDATADYSIGGSVAILVVAVFAMLKAKHIILLGQDLAYSEEGCSYVGEIAEEVKEGIMLPGYYGGEVCSRPDWKSFWLWYGREIPKMKDTQIINATEGGASIPGTKQMSFQAVLERYGDFSLDLSILEKKKYRMTETEYEKMKEGVKQYFTEAQELYTWKEEEFYNNKEKLKSMGVYALLRRPVYAYAQEEKSEWKAFQKVLEIMRENGWKN